MRYVWTTLETSQETKQATQKHKQQQQQQSGSTFISCLGERNQSDLITFIRFDVHSTTTISKVNDGQDIVGDDDDDHGHALF